METIIRTKDMSFLYSNTRIENLVLLMKVQ